MELLSLEQERARHENITYAQKNVRKCMQRVRIHDYIPGQVVYNLGEYPAKFSVRPTEYDYKLIKELSEMGVGLIQLHEDWNDAIRILGADKFSCHDPEGMKEFIKLCHSFNIKIIPYMSTGFFEERDPDFSENFTRGNYPLFSSYWYYRRCDAGSSEWVHYLTRKVSKMLDDYEFDGLYNDMGYDGDAIIREINGNNSLDSIDYDPYLEDLLVRFYSLVKEHGGICKIHRNANYCPPVKDKVYDYLWVGEAISDTESLIKTTQFDPYVIVAPDYKQLNVSNSDKLFAMTLPFLQFLLRPDGRPITGIERISVPGIKYVEDGEKEFFANVAEYNRTHPDGPYVYSEWSSIPDNPEERKKWAEYLKLYKPMVKENGICYIDIKESSLLKIKSSPNIHISLFINEQKYICMSNLGNKEETVVFNELWFDRISKNITDKVTLKPYSIHFLTEVKNS